MSVTKIMLRDIFGYKPNIRVANSSETRHTNLEYSLFDVSNNCSHMIKLSIIHFFTDSNYQIILTHHINPVEYKHFCQKLEAYLRIQGFNPSPTQEELFREKKSYSRECDSDSLKDVLFKIRQVS